jgi:prepilin-type N-terminal cleavage/methylation domain-containing protein
MKNRNGFTLLESMVAFAIMAIVAAILTQGLPFLKEKTRDHRRMYELDNLRHQIELYKNENGVYPSALSGAVYYNFFSNSDAYSGGYSTTQVTPTGYVPGLVPNYFDALPQDPLPGSSVISGCQALGWDKNIAYFSDGDHYKLEYNCASETDDYDPDSPYYDPIHPTWAWAASDDMAYAISKGW